MACALSSVELLPFISWHELQRFSQHEHNIFSFLVKFQ